jgi:dienelactone hydrolase
MAYRRRDHDHLSTIAMVLVASLGLAACTAPPEQDPAIEVVAQEGAFEPVAITLTGLGAGREVQLVATTDFDGSGMSSEAAFVADDQGRVDLAEMAPVEGSWSTPDAMGPFWSMTGSQPGLAAMWMDHDVRLLVRSDGELLAETVVERRGYGADVEVQAVTDGGMVAAYAAPAGLTADEPVPAVLVFSGSDGGLFGARSAATSVAALGYPALAISYFKSPGQPPELENVPVETFLRGLEWLRAQPGVDLDRVFTFGVSRGGEMALWLAANRPDEVYGAFAPTGASSLYCGYPDYRAPAWTLGGAGLPCSPVSAIGTSPETQVDVDEIAGPVVLACGTVDNQWDACGRARETASRLDDPTQVRSVVQKNAGHYVALAPYRPFSLDEAGADPGATHQARVDFWNAVAEVLAEARQ